MMWILLGDLTSSWLSVLQNRNRLALSPSNPPILRSNYIHVHRRARRRPTASDAWAWGPDLPTQLRLMSGTVTGIVSPVRGKAESNPWERPSTASRATTGITAEGASGGDDGTPAPPWAKLAAPAAGGGGSGVPSLQELLCGWLARHLHAIEDLEHLCARARCGDAWRGLRCSGYTVNAGVLIVAPLPIAAPVDPRLASASARPVPCFSA
jgi:hypothetical protein